MNPSSRHSHPAAALIVIGGFAGTGKTPVPHRLSTDFRLPRLGSDTLGRTIKSSQGLHNGDHAYWIAYDVLFALAKEFMGVGVIVILDMTVGCIGNLGQSKEL